MSFAAQPLYVEDFFYSGNVNVTVTLNSLCDGEEYTVTVSFGYEEANDDCNSKLNITKMKVTPGDPVTFTATDLSQDYCYDVYINGTQG